MVYWGWFILYLPWMMVRQVGITLRDLWLAWRTTGTVHRLLDGRLHIGFVGNLELVLTAGIFGERFTWLQWDDVLIDPGPARFRDSVVAGRSGLLPPTVIACTHFHEEHIGNASVLAAQYQVEVLGSPATCAALLRPPVLPGGRLLLMGQAEPPINGVLIKALGTCIPCSGGDLEVIPAAGHCCDHIALFARSEGVLFAGDAFLHELFTAPNGDTDHRAWIETLERLAGLPVRTLVGAHGGIISCDPRIVGIPGVVVRGDPSARIAAKLAFLRWAHAVVTSGEAQGVPYSVIEATLFPWHGSWAWRTWFHDESSRLLTCGEFSRTHLVRSLSAFPNQVPVRFPPLRRLAGILAKYGPELLRIHVLALRPEPVLVIAGSILLSVGLLQVLAGPVPITEAALALLRADSWLRVSLLFALWTAWWAVIGGAITRRMALVVQGASGESWGCSLVCCLRPGLLLPSALASVCLFACALVPAMPWLLAVIPPVWLVAGMLYAGMCLAPGRLVNAMDELYRIACRPWPFMRRQAGFLVGFVVSTSLVYVVAGGWWVFLWLVGGSWMSPFVLVLMAPALVYTLGYTTANLKSLQIWLYLRRDEP